VWVVAFPETDHLVSVSFLKLFSKAPGSGIYSIRCCWLDREHDIVSEKNDWSDCWMLDF
jgi:hypothetical protein